ncbi:MAG TPA: glycosyltransferase family 4 protein [Candidatus Acidoferrum sp.]|nr:glycosyltransferase family 4 protein [Candidatus Acidoferrum sp.]
MRLAVLSPFVDKQHGTERVLAELLERLASEHAADIDLYSQRVAGFPVSRPESSSPSGGAGRIVWRKVSSIPGPHLIQFLWWYAANRCSRWRSRKVRHVHYDLLYSPGINASDADAITVHIVFHEFFHQVHSQLRISKSPVASWPRILHRILYYRLIMALERRVYADPGVALSAVSQMVAGQLKRYFGRSDVLVVRNAVESKVFNPSVRAARREAARLKFGFGANDFVFLLVGNDWKKKGLDTLLPALAACDDLAAHLLVVGNDVREPYLESCKKLGLGARVRFVDPSPDVLQFYAAADAYAGPSLEDAYGLPVLESMACGLPVIVSASAGVSEIIADGENGLLLRDPRDVRQLATLLRKICTAPLLAQALGAAAERTAAKESWEEYARQMREHFEQIISKKKQANRRE